MVRVFFSVNFLRAHKCHSFDIFRSEVALKCIELLAGILSSAQHCVHRILSLLFPFALILRPQTARHLSFAHAVVTSILSGRTIEGFNWSNHAKSKICSIPFIPYIAHHYSSYSCFRLAREKLQSIHKFVRHLLSQLPVGHRAC